MKKKEMIRKLAVFLKNCCPSEYQNDSYKALKADAILLLDVIEKSGMKPPLRKVQGVFGDDWQNVWEEDDKK